MAKALSSSDVRCSVARTLEVVGERWTLLIVREAFWGKTRFSEFRDRLGVASDVLTDRLATLVEYGILERSAYHEAGARERDHYLLTAKGQQLTYVLAALSGWGDVNRPTGFGPAALWTDAATGAKLRLAFVDEIGHEVTVDRVALVHGPGSLSAV